MTLQSRSNILGQFFNNVKRNIQTLERSLRTFDLKGSGVKKGRFIRGDDLNELPFIKGLYTGEGEINHSDILLGKKVAHDTVVKRYRSLSRRAQTRLKKQLIDLHNQAAFHKAKAHSSIGTLELMILILLMMKIELKVIYIF